MTDKLNAIAEEILLTDTTHVFGIPGSGDSLTLINQLNGRDVTFVTCYFEGSAAIIASTLGHLSNSPGICISIKGPGLTNMLPGIAVSFFEHFPMIAVAESAETSSLISSHHKILDHRLLAQPIVKGVFDIDENGDNFRAALKHSSEEIPGPTLFNLARTDQKPFITDSEPGYEPFNELTSGDFRIIEKSNAPIIIVGSMATRVLSSCLLGSLTIPIFTTVAAKGFVDEHTEFSAGIYTGAGLEKTPESSIPERSDLIIGLGLQKDEFLKYDSFPCKLINLDLTGLAKSRLRSDVETDDEPIHKIIQLLNNKHWGSSEILASKKCLYDSIKNHYFLPALVYKHLERKFASNVRLVLDTGLFCTIAEHYWRATKPNDILLAANSRYMGTGLPMAIASAIYSPQLPTVVTLGDGGVAMFLAEAKLIVDLSLPILIILFSDGGFSSIRVKEELSQLHPSVLTRKNPSWVNTFESLGISSFSVATETEFDQSLNSWTPHDGPRFIECVVTKDQYQTMTDNIR